MEKLNRSQLPDSSSSPPLSIFHNFDDDGMSDLPSCVYASAHHHHHQLSTGQISLSNLPMQANNGSSGPSTAGGSNNNLRMSSTNFRQIHQHFMHHEGDPPTTSTSSSVTLNNYTAQSLKAHRQQSGVVRERKRTLRTAPNG